MVEAVRTTASPAAIWVICIVAVSCLAFWLFMISYVDRHPYVRNRRLPTMPGPVLGGYHVAEGGRSVAPNRELPADFTMAERAPAEPATAAAPAGAPAEPSPTAAGPRAGRVPAQRTATGGTSADDIKADAPTEPIPAQRTDAGAAGAESAEGAEGADAAADHRAGSAGRG
jgi:hypothetical protein